jgi:hypothetical protein
MQNFNETALCFSEIKTKFRMLVDAGFGYEVKFSELEDLELVARSFELEAYQNENFFVVVGNCNGLFAVDIDIE